ncbi:hypothetical protein M5K25_025959 [Dendrobium thyrsiflorum]|uniref:Uncharacterized protein n=1 Tax=Dendrobium thyrsiflorum TaxID=117978 RepID=A0ABD0TW89_DENTH
MGCGLSSLSMSDGELTIIGLLCWILPHALAIGLYILTDCCELEEERGRWGWNHHGKGTGKGGRRHGEAKMLGGRLGGARTYHTRTLDHHRTSTTSSYTGELPITKGPTHHRPWSNVLHRWILHLPLSSRLAFERGLKN